QRGGPDRADGRRAGHAPRRPRPDRGTRPGPVPGRRRTRRPGGPGTGSAGRPFPGRPSADARAAAHPSLRRGHRRARPRRAGGGPMTATTSTSAHGGQHGTSGGRSPLAGTSTLLRFLLRRDRIKLPAWVGGLGLFVLYISAALPQLAPTEEDLDGVVPLFTQPVGRMFTGPAFGMEAPT